MKLGVNLPAVARPKRVLAWPHDEYGAPREPVVKQPTPVFLYFGIIDILQVREARARWFRPLHAPPMRWRLNTHVLLTVADTSEPCTALVSPPGLGRGREGRLLASTHTLGVARHRSTTLTR